ncbi:hypothetical protein ISF_08446 [Cordyceps fumosorosea ARSEF 2679]|uniref:non-specific serine/threonine protein kinase n=1 Tax=Cordyceps fumosorosea (strain ARSEF 2679) TaxID=1081104 RepID=A0A167MD24_CORFA|nr:hypothetical protein ISF_08446 [Cordyceps fumosorosea ARSEF 2679]OAA54219.1 hypothetical protein ISF_08446 [Cordyceps fumosorosea ARSEF 2679]
MASPRISLIDFGPSCWRHKHRTDVIQPVALRAPEVIVGAPLGHGRRHMEPRGSCTWSGLYRASSPSIEVAPDGAPWSDEEQHLAKMAGLCGPFPPSLLQKGRRSAEFVDEQGTLVRGPSLACPKPGADTERPGGPVRQAVGHVEGRGRRVHRLRQGRADHQPGGAEIGPGTAAGHQWLAYCCRNLD